MPYNALMQGESPIPERHCACSRVTVFHSLSHATAAQQYLKNHLHDSSVLTGGGRSRSPAYVAFLAIAALVVLIYRNYSSGEMLLLRIRVQPLCFRYVRCLGMACSMRRTPETLQYII